LSLARKYPFLVDAARFIKSELGYELPLLEVIAGDEDILGAAARLLEAAARGKPLPGFERPWVNVLAYHAALAAAGASGSLRLKRRLVDAIAFEVREALRGEDLEGLFRVASALGLPLSREKLAIPWLYGKKGLVPRILVASVPLAPYLGLIKLVEASDELRLVNSFLLGGRVYLDRPRLEGLLVAGARARAFELMEAYAEDVQASRLVELGRRAAMLLEQGVPSQGYDPSLAPECIRRIEARVASGEASDEELYVLVTFLAAVGAEPDYLADIIYSSGTASRPLASIIAESLILEAKRFRPYRCEVLREKRICECSEDLTREYFSRLRARARGRSQGGD